MWRKKTGGRTQTNRASPTNSARLRSRTGLDSLFFGCSTFFLLSLLTPLRAAVVNVTINPETNPIQTSSGNIVPDGTALFVVSYKTTQDDFFTALRGASSAAELVAVFSNQLQFFNSTPLFKGDYGTYENPAIGWSSEGGASAEITKTLTSNLPIFALFSSSTIPFDSTASFLLVKSVSTTDYIPTAEEFLPTIVIAPSFIDEGIVSGSDVIFGQLFFSSGAFQMAAAGAYGQITSLLTQTNATSYPSTYQITANNGADRFFATTNTGSTNLTLTNLPVGFSIATNTYVTNIVSTNTNSTNGIITTTTNTSTNTSPYAGLITAGTNASEGTYSIRLVASNSVTASVATNTLTWVLKTPNLSFTSGPSSITATLGKTITNRNFVSTGINPTYAVGSGKLFGLTLTTSNGVGVLSGTPTSVGSNSVWIQSSAGTNVGATNFTLVVDPFSISIVGLTQAGVLECTAGVAQTNLVTNSEGYTDLTGELVTDPSTPGLSFNGSSLVIPNSTVPLLKGSSNISLKLIASKVIGATIVSASTTVPLRIVAPTPTALTPAGPFFQVAVGEDYSLQLATDVSAICPNQNIAIDGTLPLGLINNTSGSRKTGSITGKNISTTLPWDFSVDIVADTSTYYEGGGTLRVPVRFQLYNPAAPVINSSSLTKLAGVGIAFSQYSITASGAPVRFTATGLPPGLALVEANIGGTPTGNINGTPTSAGIKTVDLTAQNYFRPGDPSSILQIGTASFQIYVSGAKPSKTASVFGANDLRVGTAASLSAGEGYRINGYGLPPGLIFDRATGLITGTPTVAGTFTPTLFIQNSLGWISRTVTLRVQ